MEVWDAKLSQLLTTFETMIEEIEGFGPCASIVQFVPTPILEPEPEQQSDTLPNTATNNMSQPLLATAGSDRQLRVVNQIAFVTVH